MCALSAGVVHDDEEPEGLSVVRRGAVDRGAGREPLDLAIRGKRGRLRPELRESWRVVALRHTLATDPRGQLRDGTPDYAPDR